MKRVLLWLTLQFVVAFVVLFDIPIARQIIVGLYLTMIPGMLLLQLLHPRLDTVQFMLFSIGLSIAVLMFIGFGTNIVARLFEVPGLTQNRLLFVIIIISSILFGIFYLQDNKLQLLSRANFRLSRPQIILFVLPVLSIAGAITQNVSLMLFTIVLTALLYLVSLSSETLFPSTSYQVIVLVIALTLIFHTTLVSNNLMGFDIHMEYHVFKQTETDAVWVPPSQALTSQISNYQSTLSITILPTIFSQLLNVNGEVIFKVIYPLLYTLVPIALYTLYCRRVDKRGAFLAVLFVMISPTTFFGAENMSLTRQMIAEIFLVLSILTMSDKTDSLQRVILFILFGVGLIVSHYALAFIFLFYLLSVFFFSGKIPLDHVLNRGTVLLYVIILFVWYVHVSPSPTLSLMNVGQNIYLSFFSDIFNPDARSWVFTHILTPSSLASRITQYLYYTSQFFIGLGVIQLVRQRKKLDREHLLFSLLSAVLIGLCVLVPRLAPSFNFTRFYHIAIIFLAPAFTIGSTTSLRWITNKLLTHHRSNRVLIFSILGLVLSVSLLFQTGFVNHVANSNPTSYSLEIHRIETLQDISAQLRYDSVYTSDYDACSATWLAAYTDNVIIYGDRMADIHPLVSYGLTPPWNIKILYNSTTFIPASYIYLREINVIDGIIVPSWDYSIPSPTALILPKIQSNIKIYSNGASEVYHVLTTL